MPRARHHAQGSQGQYARDGRAVRCRPRVLADFSVMLSSPARSDRPMVRVAAPPRPRYHADRQAHGPDATKYLSFLPPEQVLAGLRSKGNPASSSARSYRQRSVHGASNAMSPGDSAGICGRSASAGHCRSAVRKFRRLSEPPHRAYCQATSSAAVDRDLGNARKTMVGRPRAAKATYPASPA